jgi:hypothetical protein
MLLFKKKFLDQIRRGEKTQTIRLWNCQRMRPGQRSYVPGVGYIAIISVEPVELAGLTDADAILDGFPSADLLRKEIRTLYTTEKRKTLIPYRIRFSVYPPREQQRMLREQKKKKQQEKIQQNHDVRQQERIAQMLDKLREMSKEPTKPAV